MKRALGIVLTLALLAVGLLVTPASGQQVKVLRVGHVGGPGSIYEIVGLKFAATVNESLKGRVEVKVVGSSQLGTDVQMLRGLKIGAPEMAILSSVVASAEPRVGVFEMPYIVANRVHMKKVAEHPQIQHAIFDRLPSQGMRVLGVWENGLRHLTNNARPIEKPEDLKGLKIRIPAGAWWAKLFKAFGASPSTIPTVELFKALQSGVVDGQEAPFPIMAAEKLQEVQKYLSLTGHAYSPALLMISDETWKSLPSDVQTTLAKVGWDMGNFARSEGERLDKELLKKLAPPMKLNEVNKDPFIKASAPIYEEFSQQVPGGKELITVIQSLR